MINIKFLNYSIIIILFLTIPYASPELISSEFNHITPLIIGNSNEATYSFEIKNNQDHKDRFSISTSEEYWSWSININPSVVEVNKKSEDNFLLKIKPTLIKEPGEYIIPIKIKSINNESLFIEKEIRLNITSYEDAINYSLDNLGIINPNEETLFKVNLENNYNLDIKDLRLVLESEFFLETQEINLSKLEKTKKNFLVKFDGDINKGEHHILIKIYSKENLILVKEEHIEIGDFPNLEGYEMPKQSFLFSSETIVKRNNGNSIVHETYSKELTTIENFITTTSEPSSKIREGNKYILTWEFYLSPGESKTIVIEKDYRKIVSLLIIFIVLLGLVYSYKKKEIIIKKDILSIKQSKDGVLSMDIVVSLKNKSRRDIKNLKLLDKIGHLVDSPSHFGSKEPKIIKSNENAQMLWYIPILKGKSNFVVSYNVKIKHDRISNLIIPKAVSKYLKIGRKKIVYSNRIKPFLK